MENDKKPVPKQSKYCLSLAYGLEKVKTRMGRELTVAVFSILLQLTIFI